MSSRMMPWNQRGVSAFGAMIALLTLSMVGLTAAYLTMMGEVGKESNFVSLQAYYIAQAGGEYALKQYYDGNDTVSIVEPGKDFGGGSFLLEESGSPTDVKSTGRFGKGIRDFKIRKPNMGKCTSFNAGSVLVAPNNKIKQVYFSKKCLASIIVDKVTISWTTDGGEKIDQFSFQGANQYTQPPQKSSGDLIDIPNYTVSDGANKEIIIDFDPANDMRNKSVTILFTMSDASTKSVVFSTPP